MRRVKSEFNGGGSRASFGHHDPDENNFNGSSYITRLSYSLFRSSLALDRSTMVGKTLRRGEANLGGKKKKKKKKKVGNRAMRRRKREREGEKERKKERERDAHEGAFCFVGPGKHRTGSGVSAVAMPFTRGGRTALTVFPLRELLGGPHGGVCSPLRRPLFSSLHEWKDVGILTVKVWLLTTRGGSRTAVESSAARLFAAYDRPAFTGLPSPCSPLSGNRSLILSINELWTIEESGIFPSPGDCVSDNSYLSFSFPFSFF